MQACLAHDTEEVLGACERCGDFICKLDSRVVERKRLCLKCAPILEADYLERYRRELWGRMDGFVALFGILCPLATLTAMWWAPPLEAAFAIGGTAIFCAYLLRKPWARGALFLLPAAGIGLAIPHGREATLEALGAALFPTLLITAAHFNTRNRLAFRLPVSEAALRRLWDLTRNNPRAREALALALLGVVFPVSLPVAFGLGLYALSKVDPDGDPPIGRRGQAIAAIIVSGVLMALWAVAIVAGA